jgi:hypothetical protein
MRRRPVRVKRHRLRHIATMRALLPSGTLSPVRTHPRLGSSTPPRYRWSALPSS